MARETWLRLDNENHDQVADAIMCCEGFQPECFNKGFCVQEGDCFRSTRRAYRDAAKIIEQAASEQSPSVKSAMRQAVDHLLVCSHTQEH